MIALSVPCPDCGTNLTVTRGLPDDVAEVLPNPCSGCCRPWRAVILHSRLPGGEPMIRAQLIPVTRRHSAGILQRV